MAAGHGGQILLAESTASLLSGVDLLDLGPRRLRDVPMPVQVFQVRADGLRTDFPPLRALDASPGNLRPAVTSFIGRASEAGEVQAAVKAHRLVTLTGVGGVGKTRLALEVAGRLVDEFPDGVWFFELAAVTDPAAVPDAVAAVLGITHDPAGAWPRASPPPWRAGCGCWCSTTANTCWTPPPILSRLSSRPRQRPECGHPPRRTRIDDDGLPVPSLDVGAGVDSAAVALFVERAQTFRRASRRRRWQTAAVVEICRRLDGMPLAIEFAASRMASMTGGEVRIGSIQRFRLLVGSRRGLERHQTLRHTVAWSYDLLDDTEKAQPIGVRCSPWIRPAKRLRRSGIPRCPRRLRHARSRRRPGARRCLSPTSERADPVFDAGTIRQFAEATRRPRRSVRDLGRPLAVLRRREADSMALWDSPRQREAYDWSAASWPICARRFGGPDQGDRCRRHHRHLRGIARRCGPTL